MVTLLPTMLYHAEISESLPAMESDACESSLNLDKCNHPTRADDKLTGTVLTTCDPFVSPKNDGKIVRSGTHTGELDRCNKGTGKMATVSHEEKRWSSGHWCTESGAPLYNVGVTRPHERLGPI